MLCACPSVPGRRFPPPEASALTFAVSAEGALPQLGVWPTASTPSLFLLEMPARPLSAAFLFHAVPQGHPPSFVLRLWLLAPGEDPLCSLVAHVLSSPSSSVPGNAPLSEHKGNTQFATLGLFSSPVSPLRLTQNPLTSDPSVSAGVWRLSPTPSSSAAVCSGCSSAQRSAQSSCQSSTGEGSDPYRTWPFRCHRQAQVVTCASDQPAIDQRLQQSPP